LNEVIKRFGHDGPDVVREKMLGLVKNKMADYWRTRVSEYGEEVIKQLERAAALRAIDTHWMDHLDAMDYVRTGIGLRGYGQRDPLVEYQREGYHLFQRLLGTIKTSLLEVVFRARPAFAAAQADGVPSEQRESGGQEGSNLHNLAMRKAGQGTEYQAKETKNVSGVSEEVQTIRNKNKVGRNDPCPCGSGKKYKKCHGK
jgi:preprotein translocase subunit SecA